jgi:predicted metalloprotease with PDZ domain
MNSKKSFSVLIFVFILSLSIQTGYAQTKQQFILLSVNAKDAPKKILHSHEIMTVQPGDLTLVYPEWIPGEHGPTGPVIDMAGLKISANGKIISWRRDLVNMFAIHCQIPDDENTIEVSFDFILPPEKEGFSAGASSTAALCMISWNQVVLYPDTPKPENIIVTPDLILPENWEYYTALTKKEVMGDSISFEPVSLNMLVDSPVLTGAYTRQINITPASGVPHFIDLVSDDRFALEMNTDQINEYKKLVVEANALFDAHHYNHYDFLCTLSDHTAHFGLEHHQSSDNRMSEKTFINHALFKRAAGLLPHEYVHSWNGKYRRPAGLATGDFSTPMKDDLLWVYEGLTQYLGKVLTARSGLYSPEEYMDDLANLAAKLDNRPGRTWRPLQDTNDEAQLLYYERYDYDSWRRGTDFYDEGDLIWLEADITIRQLTKGKKSLDDFCKKFHGGESKGPQLKPYTFDDVVNALNEVAQYDWRNFFLTRLQSLSPHAPLGGIEKGGWKLVYKDTPNEMEKIHEKAYQNVNLSYSLGIMLTGDGKILDVIQGTPAAEAGLAPNMQVIAIDGRKYSNDRIHEDIKYAVNNSSPIEFIVANGEFYSTIDVDYHGGERYPYLERDTAKPDLLSSIISPLVK